MAATNDGATLSNGETHGIPQLSPTMHCRLKRPLTLPVLLPLLLSTPLAGQDAARGPDQGESQRPTVAALRAEQPPVIDGSLGDPVWSGAPVASGFIQRQPDPGAPASQETEARIVYDDDAVYVGVRLHDDRPDLIAAPLARRDASGISSDWMYVMIDSYHDRRTAFVFAVNPRGIQKDYTVYNDSDEDISWDPVWEVATSMDAEGWTAEFRIPLGQLRFDPDGEVWGLNLQRRVARTEEWTFWSPWPPNTAGYVSHFGTLTGIADLEPVRAMSIQPYARASVTRAPSDSGNPFYDENELGAAMGADLLVGLTAGLTLSGTLNPDFGQVEADPAEVNLSAFESFFSEKRPFFVERADVFRFGRVRSNLGIYSKEFFYSRRIGRAPRRTLNDSGILFVDAPQQSPIIGAAKVTGKAGPWTIGVLDAVTGQAEAEYLRADGERGETPVEPRTNYFAGRVRRELREGASILGGMFTATNRASAGSAIGSILASDAYLGGVDFEHAWADRSLFLSGYAAASRVQGSADAMTRLQTSPSRYYQRPDADHVDVDPDRTTLSGHMASLALQRRGSWDLSLVFEEASPGFEMNDLGFQGRVDYRALGAFVGRLMPEPSGIFRNRSAYLFGASAWNFDGDQHLSFFGGGANASFRNLWNVGIEGNIQPPVTDDRLTRGGPVARTTTGWNVSSWLGTDPRRSLGAELHVSAGGNREGRSERSLGLTADWRPSTAVRLRLGPSISRISSPRQYVTAIPDELATGTFGQRYVFADIDRTTVALTTRLDWTFSPTLSLELYAEPFVAAGDYSRFKEFAEPGTARFSVYGEDIGVVTEEDGLYTVDPDGDAGASPFELSDPSFNVRSLRGNAVLRWEYLPGSTLFFVWQQERSERAPFGDFAFQRDAGEILDAPSTNVLLIKVTYWLGR